MSRVKKDSINDISILVKDFDNINNICTQQQDQFWKTIGRIKWRENEIQKPALATEAALIGFSAGVTYHSFNKSIVSKSRDLVEAKGQSNKIAAVEDEDEESQIVVFTTEGDADVCEEFCEPLEGEEFDINDSDLDDATPPLHLHCRCTLEPV